MWVRALSYRTSKPISSTGTGVTETGTSLETSGAPQPAVEVVRSGGVRGREVANLGERAFDDYVVDRFDTPQGGRRIYLRPKVPFGAESS